MGYVFVKQLFLVIGHLTTTVIPCNFASSFCVALNDVPSRIHIIPLAALSGETSNNADRSPRKGCQSSARS